MMEKIVVPKLERKEINEFPCNLPLKKDEIKKQIEDFRKKIEEYENGFGDLSSKRETHLDAIKQIQLELVQGYGKPVILTSDWEHFKLINTYFSGFEKIAKEHGIDIEPRGECSFHGLIYIASVAE